jgi:hypothetical protein
MHNVDGGVNARQVRGVARTQPPVAECPDERRGHADAHALQYVANHMRHCGAHCQVLLVGMVIVVVIVVIVVVPMSVVVLFVTVCVVLRG